MRIDDKVLAQLLVVERVDIGLGMLFQKDLAHAEHARAIAIADDANGELAARKILLDQRRLLVALDNPRHGGLKLRRRVHERSSLATFAGTFRDWFDEGREVGPASGLARILLSDREGRGLNAGIAHETLGHRLVERSRHCEGVGEQVGLVEQLAERRHLSLTRPALHPFGDGEHEIEALAGDQPCGKCLPAADTHRLAAERLERVRQRVDGSDRVELGHLLLGEAKRAIIVAQIVDECDTH
jgi:hypothetical protein